MLENLCLNKSGSSSDLSPEQCQQAIHLEHKYKLTVDCTSSAEVEGAILRIVGTRSTLNGGCLQVLSSLFHLIMESSQLAYMD